MLDYERIQNFYDQHRSERVDDPDFLRGTIETSRGITRFRYRAEARHLARVLKIEPGQRVLDLGAGTGRWSIHFAQAGARVSAVEWAPSLAAGITRNAQHYGVEIDVRVGSILRPPLADDERFDVVHVGNTLLYITDADVERFPAIAHAQLAPGGVLVLRECVDPKGPSQVYDAEHVAIYRRPERYLELFREGFRLLYQRTTVSHLVPRGSSTLGVASAMRSATWQKPLIDFGLPLLGYVDYWLLGLEERLRASPLDVLLGDPGVVQQFYVFARTGD